MTPLYLEDLPPMECMLPGCTTPHPHPVVVGARCHPGKGVVVRLDQEGAIAVECRSCGRHIIRLAIARRPVEMSGESLGEQLAQALEGLVSAIDPASLLGTGEPSDELEAGLITALRRARGVLALAKAVMR